MNNIVVINKSLKSEYEDIFQDDCPQCNQWAYVYQSLLTGESGIDCHFCGYHYSHFLVSDKGRSSSDPYETDIAILDENGNVQYDTNEERGFGVSNIHINDKTVIQIFRKPITEVDVEIFRAQISLPGVDRNKSYLTKFDLELNRVELLIGDGPD